GVPGRPTGAATARDEQENTTMSATQSDSVVVPDDLRTFAREQGVEQYLPGVLATAQRIFPEAVVSFELDFDPEIEDMCHILVVIDCVRRNIDEALQRQNEYVDGLFAFIPAPVICTFRFRTRFGP